MYFKKILFYIGLIAIMMSCGGQDLDDVYSVQKIKSLEYATFNFKFEELEKNKNLNDRLNSYMKVYNYASRDGKWQYKDELKVNEINSLFFYINKYTANVDAVYMFLTKNSKYKGNTSDIYETSMKAYDGAKIIRIKDKAFIKRIIKHKIDNQAYSFSRFTNSQTNEDYLYFFDYSTGLMYENDSGILLSSMVSYYFHEAYHLYPQDKYQIKSIKN